MTDKPKLPPPLPPHSGDGDDSEDETLVGATLEIPIPNEAETEPNRAAPRLDRPAPARSQAASGGGDWASSYDSGVSAPADDDASDTADDLVVPHRDAAPPYDSGPRYETGPRQESAPSHQPAPHYEPTPAPSQASRRPAPGFRDALKLFIVGALGCTLLISVVAVREWLAPWLPLVSGLGVAAILSASVGFLYCEREQKDAFLRGFGICVAIALPTVLWMVTPVRVAAVEQMGAGLSIPAQLSALNDPAGEVRSSACAIIGAHEQAALEPQLENLFANNPKLGAQCVQKLATTDRFHAVELAHRFVLRWYDALENQEPALACKAAPQLFAMNVSGNLAPARKVTYCAMTAEDGQLAQCCAGALTSRYSSAKAYAEALGDPTDVALDRRPALFAAMVPHAFKKVDASRRKMPELEHGLMRHKPVQDWVLALGCDGVLSGRRADDFAAGLEGAAASQRCDTKAGGKREVDAWVRICGGMASGEEPSGHLCVAMQDEAVAKTVQDASAIVHSALDGLYASRTGKAIIRGAAKLQALASSAAAPGQLIADSLSPQNLPGNVGDGRTRAFGARISAGFKNSTLAKVYAEGGSGGDDSAEGMNKRMERGLHKFMKRKKVDQMIDKIKHMSPAQRRRYWETMRKAHK